MVAILTVADLKTHVETDLGDPALQRIIDALDSEIIARCGALTAETYRAAGYSRDVVLPRAAAAVTGAVEAYGTDSALTLDASDFELWPGGLIVRRLATGVNIAAVWAPETLITFTPRDDLARRKLAMVDLAKIELQYNGLAGERIGDYASTSAKREEEREAIFRSIMPRRGWAAA